MADQSIRSPLRHTSQRTLRNLTHVQFWEACRDGDLDQVTRMTAWAVPAEESVKASYEDTWVSRAGSTINTPTESERFLQHAKQARTTQPTRAQIADLDFELEDRWYYGVEGASTSLHIACICGREEVVAALLHAGADSQRPTAGGLTLLHLAVRFNHTGVAALLLRCGADLNARADDGSRAEDYSAGHAMDATIRAHRTAVSSWKHGMLRDACPTPVNIQLPRQCDGGRVAFWLDDIFDQHECTNMRKAVESTAAFEPLMRAGCSSYRGSYRDMRLAVDLFKRIAPALPQSFKGGTLCKLEREFEASKFHSNDSTVLGSASARVADGAVLIVQLYLCCAERGGSTLFPADIEPGAPYAECEAKEGRVLVFEPNLMHQEGVVEAGIKYTLSTRAIYKSAGADDGGTIACSEP